MAITWMGLATIFTFEHTPGREVSLTCTPPYFRPYQVHLYRYMAACIVQSWPYTHPLNIAWMSENTGSVGKRTIASGAIIGAANIYGSE